MTNHLEIKCSKDGHRDIYVDGTMIKNVRSLYVDYESTLMPQAVITLDSVSDIDDNLPVEFSFESDDTRECLRYLSFLTNTDTDFHDELIKRINDVLDSENLGPDSIAESILREVLR